MEMTTKMRPLWSKEPCLGCGEEDWEEYFGQTDIYPSEMEIVGVKIEDD